MEQANMLSYVTPGERVLIEDIVAEESVRHRFHAMGLLRGRELEIIRHAKFGGPLQIRVGSVHLIIRRSEADYVKVTRLP